MKPALFLIAPLLFFLSSANLCAQRKKVQNLPKYDSQRLHFGFTLGINNATFAVKNAPRFMVMDSVYVVEPQGSAGFNLGIISDMRIGEYFNIRFIPSLSFVQRDLNYKLMYRDKAGETLKKPVESTFIDLPLDLKFKSARVNNYRMYLLLGGKYSIDMASQAKVEVRDKNDLSKAIVKIKRNDYGYHIGFGMDFYLEFFKFATDIRMFNGMNNLLVKDSQIFSRSINGLNSRIFLLSFTFE